MFPAYLDQRPDVDGPIVDMAGYGVSEFYSTRELAHEIATVFNTVVILPVEDEE